MRNVFIILIVLFLFAQIFDYGPLQIIFADIYSFISHSAFSIIIGFVLFGFIFFWFAKKYK
ncbi:hypothetical protein D7Z54_33475 [Salibacterium salarium]|uniref:Uncharacterized protein n=1 Tax=Salibacterium salarium TaxID=284579 RepID=A0A428MSB1_9BACI|nr:hypothetical protein [Salibacterium salarium]RSL29009.1 hypothetical protein D7Z54_33475 [Salibacterium salarium]